MTARASRRYFLRSIAITTNNTTAPNTDAIHPAVCPAHLLADEAGEHGAGDAEQAGEDPSHLLFAGHDQAGEGADDEADE